MKLRSETVRTFENGLPARPRKKWDTIEQYIQFLRHFAAYIYAETFVRGKSILEIGCGTGYGADYLSQFASNIIAIDISKKCVMYSHTTCKKENVNFLLSSGLHVPLKDDSIDIVLSFQVIEHIESRKVRDFLSDIKRVLKDRGVFIASTPNKKLRLLPFQKPWNPEHRKEYNYKEFKEVLGNFFEEVEVYGLKGSEQIQSIEQNRVKQKPLNVYVIKPLIPLIRKLLPSTSLFRLKEMKKSIIRNGKKGRLIPNETFEKIQPGDLKLLPYCPKDCLDSYGICKKIKKERISS